MTKMFRILDLRENPQGDEVGFITGNNPETAAEKLLGLGLTRSGIRSNLAAKVYWDDEGGTVNMVRLYQRKCGTVSSTPEAGSPSRLRQREG